MQRRRWQGRPCYWVVSVIGAMGPAHGAQRASLHVVSVCACLSCSHQGRRKYLIAMLRCRLRVCQRCPMQAATGISQSWQCGMAVHTNTACTRSYIIAFLILFTARRSSGSRLRFLFTFAYPCKSFFGHIMEENTQPKLPGNKKQTQIQSPPLVF